MILLYCIPTSSIKANVWRSHSVYDFEGSYPQWAPENKMTQLDNVTDGYMLLEAMYAGGNHPVQSAMLNPYTVYEGVNPDKAAVLESHDTPGAAGTGNYGRYWHGYLLFLKPLLLFFEVSDLRIMNMILCLGLSFYFFFLVERNLGRKNLISSMIAWLVINPVSVIMSFQFSTTFYVMLFSSIIVLKKYKWLREKRRYEIFFLLIGIVTNFIDFLTYPLVGMAIPLILALLLETRNGDGSQVGAAIEADKLGRKDMKKQADRKKCLRNIQFCITNSMIWLIGYAGMWFGKWMAGSALTGQNFVSNALSEAEVQSTGQNIIAGIPVSPLNSILKNMRVIVKWPFILLMLVVFLYAIAGIHKGTIKIADNRNGIIPALLLVALYPMVWFSVMQVHSMTCYWFTYRNLSVTILAILVAISQCLEG